MVKLMDELWNWVFEIRLEPPESYNSALQCQKGNGKEKGGHINHSIVHMLGQHLADLIVAWCHVWPSIVKPKEISLC